MGPAAVLSISLQLPARWWGSFPCPAVAPCGQRGRQRGRSAPTAPPGAARRQRRPCRRRLRAVPSGSGSGSAAATRDSKALQKSVLLNPCWASSWLHSLEMSSLSKNHSVLQRRVKNKAKNFRKESILCV